MVSLRRVLGEIEFGGRNHISYSNLADLQELVFKCLLSGGFSSAMSYVKVVVVDGLSSAVPWILEKCNSSSQTPRMCFTPNHDNPLTLRSQGVLEKVLKIQTCGFRSS